MKKLGLVLGLGLAVCIMPIHVKAENVSGGAVGVTPPISVSPGGAVAPIAPVAPVVPTTTEITINPSLAPAAGLRCKAGANLKSGTISWTPYAGAVSYVVYRKTGSGEYQWLRNMAGTSFTDNGLKAGASYTYKIQAKLPVQGVARQFELTPFSSEVTMKLKPAKVKGFKAKARRGSITLSWKKGKKGKVSGYEIWGKVNVKLKGIKIKFSKMKTLKSYKKNRLKHKMLVKGMSYSYKIRCYKKVNGKKIYSDYVTIKKRAK